MINRRNMIARVLGLFGVGTVAAVAATKVTETQVIPLPLPPGQNVGLYMVSSVGGRMLVVPDNVTVKVDQTVSPPKLMAVAPAITAFPALQREDSTYSGTGNITTVKVPVTPLFVYRNGMLMSILQGDYTVTGQTVVPNSWVAGDAVTLVYYA